MGGVEKRAHVDGIISNDTVLLMWLSPQSTARDAGNPFDVSRIDLLRLLARYCQVVR